MSSELVARLKALQLHGMAQCWPELLAKARHSDLTPERLMAELLAAESAEREVRSTAYQMKAARFPAHRDLAELRLQPVPGRRDPGAPPPRGRVQLGTAQNVVLIGGPGTGKTGC